MRYTKYKNIYFIEYNIENINIIKHIDVKLKKIFSEDQLNSLITIKEKMINKIPLNIGNAVINFKYGQKTGGLFESIFSLDRVYWYGSGDLVFLSDEQINTLLKE